MSITFRKNVKSSVNKNTTFKHTLESLFGKKLNTAQVNRIKTEILESGFITSESSINERLLKEYAEFKSYFPKYSYRKSELEKAKEIIKDIEHDDYVYSAESIFYKIKELLPGLADSTVYYWFEKVGSKFSTIKSYNKDVTTLVIYQAVKRKENLSTAR